jgi:competence protein ComGF
MKRLRRWSIVASLLLLVALLTGALLFPYLLKR